MKVKSIAFEPFDLHAPVASTSTLTHLAMHAFEYVLPSLPQTGFTSLVHLHGFSFVVVKPVVTSALAVVVALGLAVVVALGLAAVVAVVFLVPAAAVVVA